MGEEVGLRGMSESIYNPPGVTILWVPADKRQAKLAIKLIHPGSSRSGGDCTVWGVTSWEVQYLDQGGSGNVSVTEIFWTGDGESLHPLGRQNPPDFRPASPPRSA